VKVSWKDLLSKFVSRKLLVTILAPIVVAKWPVLLPLIQYLAPAYVLGQGSVDAVKAVNAWKGNTVP
jgi:hypothetical protein